MGGDLPRSLDALLFARPHEDAAATRGRDRLSSGKPGRAAGPFRQLGSGRKTAPAARRNPSSQTSLRTEAGAASREPVDILAAVRLGDRDEAIGLRPFGRPARVVE